MNLDRPGLFSLVLVDLGADLDLLDGDADLAGLVLSLDQVLANDGLGALRGQEDLGQALQRGGDHFLFNAFGLFLLVSGPVLAGDALARFLDHVGVGSKSAIKMRVKKAKNIW